MRASTRFRMPQRNFHHSSDGRVEERVEGVQGETCQQLTEQLEAALGTVERRESTAEAFLQPETQNQTLPAHLN